MDRETVGIGKRRGRGRQSSTEEEEEAMAAPHPMAPRARARARFRVGLRNWGLEEKKRNMGKDLKKFRLFFNEIKKVVELT